MSESREKRKKEASDRSVNRKREASDVFYIYIPTISDIEHF